jgi:hypothetical protein
MQFAAKLPLPFEQWPKEDRTRWEDALRDGDIFADGKRGTHLSEATRKALCVAYS